jgi:hypothetical protein
LCPSIYGFLFGHCVLGVKWTTNPCWSFVISDFLSTKAANPFEHLFFFDKLIINSKILRYCPIKYWDIVQ